MYCDANENKMNDLRSYVTAHFPAEDVDRRKSGVKRSQLPHQDSDHDHGALAAISTQKLGVLPAKVETLLAEWAGWGSSWHCSLLLRCKTICFRSFTSLA